MKERKSLTLANGFSWNPKLAHKNRAWEAINETGNYYFLETSSRVGGANLAEMIEAASGVNLWAEWAKLEIAVANKTAYKPPKDRRSHAGIAISLSKFEKPDTHAFEDAELVWRLDKKWHIGLIVKYKNIKRVKELLDNYTQRIQSDFHTSAPIPDKSA